MLPINVTKTFLPPIEEYEGYLRTIWNSRTLTNHGLLVQQLEERLQNYLKTPSLHLVANGTIALQLALQSFNITDGEIITTPFSYVATTSAILWQRCEPIFVDIDPKTFCIDSLRIESAITERTKAILAVHVFGNLCDVEGIEKIAQKYNIPVIYDAAHAFGVSYKGRSFAEYGDVVTCSFHATKLFHTCEGGAVMFRDINKCKEFPKIRSFGHIGDEHYCLGINGKMSELHAAMGLCNINYINGIIAHKRVIAQKYDLLIGNLLERLSIPSDLDYTYGYYPVLFKSEAELLSVFKHLNQNNIFPRRYFYPSLNTLPYLTTRQSCPISENIASRVACLPNGFQDLNIVRIVNVIKKALKLE